LLPALPAHCPSCSAALEVERLRCPSCATRVGGQFELPPLLQLPSDDLEFIVAFVRASGSLKEMAELRHQSYPTIRNRLDEIISRLEGALTPPSSMEPKTERAILQAVAEGAMSVAAAARKLREARS
jgi:hypothetical protein